MNYGLGTLVGDRNAGCICGSGKKHKKCCLYKDQGWEKNEQGNWVLPIRNIKLTENEKLRIEELARRGIWE